MKLKNTHTKIFLESADPQEVKKYIADAGSAHIAGVRIHLAVLADNPVMRTRLAETQKYSQKEFYEFYKKIAKEMSDILPQKSISIEVYSDIHTPALLIKAQARKMHTWTPRTRIAFPITTAGLEAAEELAHTGMGLDIVFVYTQEQAAAVFTATNGAPIGALSVSVDYADFQYAPIQHLYKESDQHVDVCVSGISTVDELTHLLETQHGAVSVTPRILQAYHTQKEVGVLMNPPTEQIDTSLHNTVPLNRQWQSYVIENTHTDKRITQLTDTWNRMIA